MMAQQKLTHIATEWRKKCGYTGRDGVVLITQARNWCYEVCGWMDKLRDPQQCDSGCIAVDEQGNQWIATGGTITSATAQRWVKRA